jgi:hypothetical protein
MGNFATSEENGGELADALFMLKVESELESYGVVGDWS